MGHTPRITERIITLEAAKAAWFRVEAQREIDAALDGKHYARRPFPERNFVPGRGLVFPPSGGSGVTRAKR